MSQTAQKLGLRSETLQAFDAYIREEETAMDATLSEKRPDLWSDASPGRAHQVRQGKIIAQFWAGEGPLKIEEGLIHDWAGAAFVPGAAVEQTVRLVQDYNNHKNIYKPEVIDSKLLNRNGNDFQIYLRLLKKKIITVVLDTYHDVHYSSLDPKCWLCRSYTTRIQEVDGAGTQYESVLPPDTGHGFLWRLYSYWKFQEKEGGVFVECRAISLSRNVPLGLGWMIDPIIRQLPRESLINTLSSTCQAIAGN